MRYTTRPLSDRTWLRPETARRRSQFDSTWTDTLELLAREIKHLRGRDVVIEVDIREQDIRLDGMLRATARAETPAVVVAFNTRDHGPMLYRADRFTWGHGQGNLAWQANVRAVALTLQALRAVDRYGATETGQQYAGFKALPAGRAMPTSHMTSEQAWDLIWLKSGGSTFAGENTIERRYKAARAAAHPDRHDGDRTLWDQVEEAAQVLRLSR
jgi:hypothetical protein